MNKYPALVQISTHVSNEPLAPRLDSLATATIPMSVVIVSYNTCDELYACLATVVAETPYEVIVVDNASSDGSVEMVRALYPSVILIANTTNQGYGAAANQGVAAATAPYVLLLNSDTQLQTGSLRALHDYLEHHPRAAIVGPRLINLDGTQQPSSFAFPTPLQTLLRETRLGEYVDAIHWLRRSSTSARKHNHPQVVPWVLGAALAIRREAFIAIGGFNESFFLYYEEVDLCYRAGAAGWEVHFAPVTSISHVKEASTGRHRVALGVQLYHSLNHFYRQHYSRHARRILQIILGYLMLRNIARDACRLLLVKNTAQRIRIAEDLTLWSRVLVHVGNGMAAVAWASKDAPNGDGSHIAALVELLHPRGVAARKLCIGGTFVPATSCHGTMIAGQPADLVILAPTFAQCATRGWLELHIAMVAERLAPDGVIYILAPPGWREKIAALLAQKNIELETAMLHLPNIAASHWLIPIQSAPLHYAIEQLLPVTSWRRRVLLRLVQHNGCLWLLRRLHPSVGLIAGARAARPVFAWLTPAQPRVGRSAPLIRTSWRGAAGAVILQTISIAAQPLAVVKMRLSADPTPLLTEAANLARLEPAARQAGAHIPRVIELTQAAQRLVFVQSAIPGQLIAPLLEQRPELLGGMINHISKWLLCWNLTTRVVRSLSEADVQRTVLTPARLLAPLLPRAGTYVQWLADECAALVGAPMPFVAAHNDLSMWNVLLDNDGNLGVIDWETALEETLPLGDLVYSVVDAVAATQGHANRLSATQACFIPSGEYAKFVQPLIKRLCMSIGLSSRAANLCFHACWLQHAMNEYRAETLSGPRPFLAIVEWLASQPMVLMEN